MEVAIPIVALGAMYVMSNQDKKESFQQRIPPHKMEQELPNTAVPPINFPVQTFSELPANVKYYENANTATDKYYQQDAYENAINKNGLRESVHFQSLTGDIKPAKSLKHNNMVPFLDPTLLRELSISMAMKVPWIICRVRVHNNLERENKRLYLLHRKIWGGHTGALI